MSTDSDKTFQVTDIDINNLYVTGQRACLEKIRRLGISLIPPSDETQGWLAHANDEVLFSGYTTDEVIHRMNAMVYESPKTPSAPPAPSLGIDKPGENSLESRSKDDYKEEHLRVEILRSTPLAHRVKFKTKEAWLPRSQIVRMKCEGDTADIVIPFWLFRANFGE